MKKMVDKEELLEEVYDKIDKLCIERLFGSPDRIELGYGYFRVVYLSSVCGENKEAGYLVKPSDLGYYIEENG